MAVSRTLMVQGTASSAGKSVLVAGLCRYFTNLGLKVAPFKSQNMALNSFATIDGHEIGRAQAVQAKACKIPASVDMNPILLKPEADHQSQLVVMGKVAGRFSASEYVHEKGRLLGVAAAALDRLRAAHDLVVLEGAGSPAEVNLASHDIVNMRMAEVAEAPVLLVGDIDRGGVFAALHGTLDLLPEQHRERVAALVINKFRGDLGLLQPGLDFITTKTGKPVLGVVPFIHDIGLPDEDSVALQDGRRDGPIAVIKLPHIANWDDFDRLPVRFVTRPDDLQDAAAIVLPGTKCTAADLRWLHDQGLGRAVRQASVPVVGICGGFQMLGRRILDPDGVESLEPEIAGLGLLPVETVFEREKTTVQTHATTVSGNHRLQAYQIHMGRTSGGEPFARLDDGSFDGAVSGHCWGTYLHGVFQNRTFTDAWLESIGIRPAPIPDADPFDRLADVLAGALDCERLHRIVGL